MPLIETKGAASAQGFGEFAKTGPANYIEDVFSTYLYTGNGTSQTITNGIDLSTKGGLVWIKPRTDAASGDNNHGLYDTARGVKKVLRSNQDSAQNTLANDGLTAFNATGFSVSDDSFGSYGVNGPNGRTFVSWTFRKQPKFFDVVTYTGNGANRTIAHSLGSVPGCIIVKRTDTTGDWQVYHRSLANTEYMVLNSTAAKATGATRWNSTTPTATEFSLGTDATVNASGGTYVAYLFAHDAGGFGLTGTDNVISCGSYTGNGSATGPTITLGYEPQWLMIKRTDSTGGWQVMDVMRGMPLTDPGTVRLFPNNANAEDVGGGTNQKYAVPTATGFSINSDSTGTNANGGTYIYIAIRRGPMKTPTTGTSVFAPITNTGNGSDQSLTTNFPVDLAYVKYRTGTFDTSANRMTGASQTLRFTSTAAESNTNDFRGFASNTSYLVLQTDTQTTINYAFRRAPGFFDVVCYTGTGSATTFSHNLGVVPELMIVKMRSGTNPWPVYAASQNATKYTTLNSTSAFSTAGASTWNNTTPTASVFSVGNSTEVNGSGSTYVAYLFATVAGVSKVGSYTGSGTTKQIDCGFTGGARFVLIKRADDVGGWYVWDSARGIVAGDDPYLLLNSAAAEVTNTDYVDTYSAGFEISSTAPAAINANGGSFIFLAIS